MPHRAKGRASSIRGFRAGQRDCRTLDACGVGATHPSRRGKAARESQCAQKRLKTQRMANERAKNRHAGEEGMGAGRCGVGGGCTRGVLCCGWHWP